jgi:ribose 5-phosphate isomerase B
MVIGITNDHYGVKKKQQLIKYLEKKGHKVIDYGYNGSENEKVDYPKYAFDLVKNMDKIDIGILICTSGIGMSIAANRIKGVRCARVINKEEAIITRKHNHANCVALSGKYSLSKLKKIIDAFINQDYDDTERYERRAKMLDEC